MINQKILDAIREQDCFKLLNLLLVHTKLPDDFDLIDEHTGKSLLVLIQESSINFSEQCPVEYAWGEVNVTPLQSVFIAVQRGDAPDFESLRYILMLGANVNHPINNQGDTILHKLMSLPSHPLALKELIRAGGDIFKKNNQGKTPLDLADEITSKYLLETYNQNNPKHNAAIKIQRQWRSRNKLENKSVALTHESLPLFPKRPLRSNPPDVKKMKLWIEKHKEEDKKTAEEVSHSIQHITFEHFLFGLKMAVKKFNLYLHSLPEDKRNYVLLVDSRKDKSGPWVTKLAQQFLLFPPSVIINTADPGKFIPTMDLNHIVLFDDASYSGNLLYKLQDSYYTSFLAKYRKYMNLQFHLIVPFTTERARERFKEFPTLLHTQETIPSFKVKNTFFKGETATYFDHKIPVDLSSIECIENGKLITGESSGVVFVEPMIPPYKL
ncbi:ankyrin repeat domain-containing protein [Legionella shakespearei]|uniref:Uncharacterized protein n=1 Tax=Legionella shakespearei DSM 23087 TaxID=1122169 RepID=A0A0W0Z1S4_9GAMM|nr:ankyrin repeat domain-containing protein [Legionella shakespearei]KTD63101.1 hypothetical protein Lsha_0787 [Legionella shakespearei DSM 23087]